MNMGHRTWVCGLVLVTAACGVKSVGSLEESSSGGGSDTAGDLGTDSGSSATVTSASASESVGEVDTGNPTEPTSSDVDTGDPTVSDTGCLPDDAMCDPPRQLNPDGGAWTLSGFNEFSEGLQEVSCTLAAFDPIGETMTLTLHCDEGRLAEHVLVVPSDPGNAFDGELGMALDLTYEADPIFWVNRWFAVRDADGRLLFAGAEGSEVLPPSGNAIFLPLELTADPTACPLFEPCDVGACSTARRQAIDVLLDVESAKVFDGNFGVIGSDQQFLLRVGRAEELIESDSCDDVPPAWYNFVIFDSTLD